MLGESFSRLFMFLVHFPEVVKDDKKKEERRKFWRCCKLKSGESINKSRNTFEIGFCFSCSLSRFNSSFDCFEIVLLTAQQVDNTASSKCWFSAFDGGFVQLCFQRVASFCWNFTNFSALNFQISSSQAQLQHYYPQHFPIGFMQTLDNMPQLFTIIQGNKKLISINFWVHETFVFNTTQLVLIHSSVFINKLSDNFQCYLPDYTCCEFVYASTIDKDRFK